MGRAEGYVENYLVKQAENAGMYVRKLVSPGNNGFPDRMVLHRGRVVFIETKSATGRLSAIQRKNIAKMASHGAEVCVTSTRAEVDAVLAAISARAPLPYQIREDIWP